MAGEASGESYGAHIAKELWEKEPKLKICGMGGIEMADAGVEILVDSTELGVVGIIEVLKHIRTFLKIFKQLILRAERERPDVVILIDYPGFNLRFAKKLHKLGIKVVYYVSPQVWAWGKKRIPEIARVVDKMLAIFPFEPNVYKNTNLDVEFVGHPLLEILHEQTNCDFKRTTDTILLLPGSRISEVSRLLLPILQTAQKLATNNPNLKFVLALPRERVAKYARTIIKKHLPHQTKLKLTITIGKTREWMQKATAGIAASGTVTVESAILGLPLVSIYKINPLTYALIKWQIDLPYFTMVNLITGQKVFAEFLQGDVNANNLSQAILEIMPGGKRSGEVEAGMKKMVQLLGGHENVFKKAAEAILKTI